MKADGGLVPPQQIESPDTPPDPLVLPTKIRLSFAGSTTILVIAVPRKACPLLAPVPVPAILVSKGPLTTGDTPSAPSIRYNPTPKKLSTERLPSPVPTKTFVGSNGSIVTAPIASDCAGSINASQLAPPSVVRHSPPCAVPTYAIFGLVG